MDDLDEILGPAMPPVAAMPRYKATKRKQKPEDLFQYVVKKLLHQIIADSGCLSRDGVLWFAIEQAGKGTLIKTRNGKLLNVERVRNANKGVVSGVPDICLIYRGIYHGIELKVGKNDLQDSQRRLHPILRGAGAKVGTVWTLEELVALLDSWGVPHVKARF